jgi:hypothetical protein
MVGSSASRSPTASSSGRSPDRSTRRQSTHSWAYGERPVATLYCTRGDQGTMAALRKDTGGCVADQGTDSTMPTTRRPSCRERAADRRSFVVERALRCRASRRKVYWQQERTAPTAFGSTAIYRRRIRFYVTSGYGVCCMLVKLGSGTPCPSSREQGHGQSRQWRRARGRPCLRSPDRPVNAWSARTSKTGEQVWASKNPRQRRRPLRRWHALLPCRRVRRRRPRRGFQRVERTQPVQTRTPVEATETRRQDGASPS